MIVFKSDCSGLVTTTDTYATIDNGYKDRIIAAVEDFFDFVLVDMNTVFNFDKNFGCKNIFNSYCARNSQKGLTYIP